jgi:NAD-dependent dihydropyrimidine dehydrogenase PreA subunit
MNVKIDNSKCLGPLKCKKCLQVCPAACFTCYPKNRERGKMCDEWLLTAAYVDQCSGCGECEKICPNGALELVMSQNS